MIEYFFYTFLFYFFIFLIGLGPAFYFQDLLKIRSLLKLFIYSLILGLLFNVFSLLVLGMLGLTILGPLYPLVLFLQFSFSLGVLLFLSKSIKGVFRSLRTLPLFPRNADRFDHYFLILILIIIVTFIFLNSKVFLSESDEFRFWLTDARLIFETGALRDNTHIINNNRYSSFLPVHYAQVYKIFGRLVEQFVSIVPLLYLFLCSILLYVRFIGEKFSVRAFTFLIVFYLNLLLVKPAFTAYADIALLFYFLFTALLIFTKCDKDIFYKKFTLVSISLLAISFVKLPEFLYSPYSLVLLIIWVVVDLRNLRYLLNSFISDSKVRIKEKLIILIPFLIIIANLTYRYFFIPIDEKYQYSVFTPVDSLTSDFGQLSLRTFSNYLQELIQYLWLENKFLIIFFLAVWMVCGFTLVKYIYTKFFSSKAIKSPKEILAIIFIVILVPLINIFYYSLIGRVAQMERYLTVTIFVGGILLVDFFSNIQNKIVKGILITSLMMLIFLQIFDLSKDQAISLNENIVSIKSHNGSYTDFDKYKDEMNYAKEVRKIIGKKDILIGTYSLDGKKVNINLITNMDNDLNPFKYSLVKNTKGSFYIQKAEEYLDYVCHRDIEFVLLRNGKGLKKFYEIEETSGKLYQLYEVDCQQGKFILINGFDPN